MDGKGRMGFPPKINLKNMRDVKHKSSCIPGRNKLPIHKRGQILAMLVEERSVG